MFSLTLLVRSSVGSGVAASKAARNAAPAIPACATSSSPHSYSCTRSFNSAKKHGRNRWSNGSSNSKSSKLPSFPGTSNCVLGGRRHSNDERQCRSSPCDKNFSRHTSSTAGSGSPSSEQYRQQMHNEEKLFSAQADDWWDPEGPAGALHAYTPVRVSLLVQQLQTLPIYQQILRSLPQLQQQQQAQVAELPLCGVRIADIGCGGGLLSEGLAAAGASVTGFDSNEQLLAAAGRRQKQRASQGLPDLGSRLSYVVADACTLPKRSECGHFHAAVMSEVIEHIWGKERKAAAIAAAAARLQQGGLLMLTSLNRTPENYVASILVAEHLLSIIPKGTHDWKNFSTPEEIRSLCRAAGLRPLHEVGFIYNPFNKRFIQEPTMRLLYAMTFVKS
ncbi:3-demethylubiquinone-9 3-methyltransferase, putative [Eimeria necatrix]|uniref:3-demethylubiquinone-9 3-methyltransferase, putative n=1 Tax=Eimeria necatrix TaxID=51315 RepID=U6MF49_9EIME|nr:3-demethylubiquinone-9 3-methyltransferase, putative [Eimeria necatrix]CDJ62877.1 3-demethylubiquinone-9 3-methyltransferase, putative [Eimeria necatrix]